VNWQRVIFRIVMVVSAFWIADLVAITYTERKSVSKSLPPSSANYFLDPKFSDPFFWMLHEFGWAFIAIVLVIAGWIFAGFRRSN
jgi:hypothetical protein